MVGHRHVKTSFLPTRWVLKDIDQEPSLGLQNSSRSGASASASPFLSFSLPSSKETFYYYLRLYIHACTVFPPATPATCSFLNTPCCSLQLSIPKHHLDVNIFWKSFLMTPPHTHTMEGHRACIQLIDVTRLWGLMWAGWVEVGSKECSILRWEPGPQFSVHVCWDDCNLSHHFGWTLIIELYRIQCMEMPQFLSWISI